MDKNEVLNGYITCALNTSSDDDGEFLSEMSIEIDSYSKELMMHDVQKFITENEELLQQSGLSDEQIGHDFWLTRNRTCTGFWDRGLGEIGEKLTESAFKFEYVNLHIEDGKIEYRIWSL